jgi:hypothetical protein
MQIIYNYKHETNYTFISREQNVSVTLWLQYVAGLHLMLFPVLNDSYF